MCVERIRGYCYTIEIVLFSNCLWIGKIIQICYLNTNHFILSPTNTLTSESHIITFTFVIILMNHRIRLRHSQIRHQHSRLHIHRTFVQFSVALLRVDMRKHVIVPIVANARNRNAKVGNLQKQQLRLLRNRIQVRRRQERRTHRHNATAGKHVDHVHEDIIGHSE